MTTETTEQTAEVTRSFHTSDYARMARTIQRMRHVKGDRYTAKADQSRVDYLADGIAAVFAQDHDGFDEARFLAGTQLPADPGNVLLDSPPEDLDDEDTGDAYEVE
jgi:hypothetical protein